MPPSIPADKVWTSDTPRNTSERLGLRYAFSNLICNGFEVADLPPIYPHTKTRRHQCVCEEQDLASILAPVTHECVERARIASAGGGSHRAIIPEFGYSGTCEKR